jgi:hypothetical protein
MHPGFAFALALCMYTPGLHYDSYSHLHPGGLALAVLALTIALSLPLTNTRKLFLFPRSCFLYFYNSHAGAPTGSLNL